MCLRDPKFESPYTRDHWSYFSLKLCACCISKGLLSLFQIMNRSSASRMRIAIAGVQATMQQTVARKMRQQKFHLVSQDPSAREINVLGVCRHKRHRQEPAFQLLRACDGLVVIAPLACSDDILPKVLATFAEGFYVVARQIRISELIPTIKAQIGIPAKQVLLLWRGITGQTLKMRYGLPAVQMME